MSRIHLTLALVALLGIAGCAGQDTPGPSPSDQASVSAIGSVPAGWKIFYARDTLASPRPSPGWATFRNADGSAEYTEGGLRVDVTKADRKASTGDRLFSVASVLPRDVRIEVTAKRVEGPVDKGFYGISCRGFNKSSYYLTIGSDGFFSIVKSASDGSFKYLANDAGDKNPAIRTGLDVENRIAAECTGENPTSLTLFVNDQQVAQATDDEADLQRAGGTAFLRVDAGTTPPTGVVFNDFVIYTRA